MPPNPKAVGTEIRRLLLSLRADGHTSDEEQVGCNNYGTDDLRALALDYAGTCRLAPGEMAPGCGCDWSPKDPTGPTKRLLDVMLQATLGDHFAALRESWAEYERDASEATRGAVLDAVKKIADAAPWGASTGAVVEGVRARQFRRLAEAERALRLAGDALRDARGSGVASAITAARARLDAARTALVSAERATR